MMSTNVIELYRSPVALPAEIKALKGWLVWKLEQHAGEKKPRKVPYYIDGTKRRGEQGCPADREALASYDRACRVCEKGGYAGIGLAILPEWGITAVDFDGVITDGVIHQEVAALVAGTYSEVSPSGTGVRTFFRGMGPGNRKDNAGAPQVEFFSSKGFVTVTGNPTDICELMGNEEVLQDLTPEALALYTARFGSGASSRVEENVDPRTAREMLDLIDPDCPHDTWFHIGLGLHHQFGAEGFDLWNEWSARSKDKYPGEKTLRTRWRSIRNDEANPVTFATVKAAARSAGWAEDFSAEFQPIAAEADQPEDAPWPAMTRDRNGRIEATIDNTCKALRHGGMAAMAIGYDQFRDEIMFAVTPGQWQSFKDTHYTVLRIRLERLGFKPIGRELMRDAVAKVAEDNRFDSAMLWLESIPAWDDVPRIDQFFVEIFGAENSAYHRAVGAYVWTALAGRILRPGVKADMVPILVGEQGLKKSTAVAAMAPAIDFFCEINFVDKEVDMARRMRGRLVAEIGELRGLNSRELEHIKAFITRTHEDWTPKFKEFNTVFARRLVFIGTTNQSEFLADETGNRRFLPIKVQRADVARLEQERLQLWAEGRARFEASGVAWQDAEQLARDQHQAHMITDPWEHTVRDWLDQVGPDGLKNSARKFLRVNDVLKFALHFDEKHIGRREELRIGKVLRAVGYEKVVLWENGKCFKAWATGCPF